MKNRALCILLALLLSLSLLLTGCDISGIAGQGGTPNTPSAPSIGKDDIPPVEEAVDLFITVNDNKPYFTDEEITDIAFESYSPLDTLGRCGTAFACIGKELMPTEERDFSLTSISPSGWETKNGKSNNNVYPTSVVPGGYIYNRCHLIGYQLTAETTNKQNLITGTRSFNVDGMLLFENMVADFIKDTGYHVMYRVTPVYDGYNLLCDGVLIEMQSVEDRGEGLTHCVFIYNVQPGVDINYSTGENRLEGSSDDSPGTVEITRNYIINTNSKKVHLDTCSTGKKLEGDHRVDFSGTLTELLEKYPSYTQCGTCKAFVAE